MDFKSVTEYKEGSIWSHCIARAHWLVSVVARFESRLGRVGASVRQTAEVIHTISLVVWHRVGGSGGRKTRKGDREGEKRGGKEGGKESKAWKREKEKERRVWKARKSYKQSQERTTLQPRAKRINGERNACKHWIKVTRVFQCTLFSNELKLRISYSKNNLLLFDLLNLIFFIRSIRISNLFNHRKS